MLLRVLLLRALYCLTSAVQVECAVRTCEACCAALWELCVALVACSERLLPCQREIKCALRAAVFFFFS